ncbi:hypothetical protein EYV94_07895 [Puteibacter caeruleilacunae]|nr:hypothetical protein EYV94_07895 [Puteibacter caeruleilacunae]
MKHPSDSNTSNNNGHATSLRKVFSNSYIQCAILALAISAFLIALWEAPIKRYTLKINPLLRQISDELYWLADDFDGDGNTERLRCYNSSLSEMFEVVTYDHRGHLIEVWHLTKSKWHHKYNPSIVDLNSDGQKELVFISQRNDSLFLNALNLVTLQPEIDHLYFNTFQRKTKRYASSACFYPTGNSNNSKNKTLFFSFDAGFGLHPRGIYKYNHQTKQITSHPKVYSPFRLHPYHNNHSSSPYFYITNYAPCNINFPCRYPDTQSYITVLDHDLNFLFPPIAVEQGFSSVQTIPDQQHSDRFYALIMNRSKSDIPVQIRVMNHKGHTITQKQWTNIDNPENLSASVFYINNTPYIAFRNIGRFKLDTELSHLPNQLKPLTNNLDKFTYSVDFNDDGYAESVTWTNKDEITIFNEKENTQLSFISPIDIRHYVHFYPIYNSGKLVKTMVSTNGGFFYIQYHRNPWYFTLYLIYLSIYCGVCGSLIFVVNSQKRRIERKWQLEKTLSELQFNTIRNQLDPHFVFNAMSTIGSMIAADRKEEAYDLLTANAHMIRRTLQDTKSVKRTLNDEIEFTKHYLTIQQFRFLNKFEVNINIDTDVDLTTEVPKMVLHTYAENAIKHGFRKIKYKGILTINIAQNHNTLELTVSDNGIGREQAQQADLEERSYNNQDTMPTSTGQGLKIMEEYYQLFEKYHGYQIQTYITDNPLPLQTGTEVTITIAKQ